MSWKRFGFLIFTVFCGTDLLANAATCFGANQKKIGELCSRVIKAFTLCLLLYGFSRLVFRVIHVATAVMNVANQL